MRRPTRPGVGLLLAALAVVAAGCAAPRQYVYTPEELRAQFAVRVPAEALDEMVVPFEVPAGVLEDVKLPGRHLGDYERAKAIAAAMVDPEQLGLRYDRLAAASAVETIASGRGNCLSLASVAIGMARAAGVRAMYIQGIDRIRELDPDHKLVVTIGHVGAAVATRQGYYSIDVSGELSRYRRYRLIDDLEAVAHYYNNRGYQTVVEAGEGSGWEDALPLFELAARVAPDFAPAWNNLGIAHARLGDGERAILDYEAAIRVDPEFGSAYTNLAGLHLARGELDAALTRFEQASRLDPDNPYLHYHHARAWLRHGEPERAIATLERAVGLHPDYAAARRLLKELRAGERPRARAPGGARATP